MNQAHDFGLRAREIRDFVAGNDLDGATKKGMDFMRDFGSRDHQDEGTLIRMEFRNVEDGRRREELDFEAAATGRRKVALKLLRLMNAVEDMLRAEVVSA